MVSLTSYLQDLATQQQQSEDTNLRRHAGTDIAKPHYFPPGSRTVTVGTYCVNLSIKELDHHPTFDLRTGQPLNCKVYSHKTFQFLAPLVYSEIQGVHDVLDVTKIQDTVYVFSTRPYGDLHNFLKQRRKLKEGLAANIFKQIVLLVKDAHRKNVVLRDLKLKKFVFEDEDK